MLVMRWSSTSFEDEIASAFSLLHRALSSALTTAFEDNKALHVGMDAYRKMHAELLRRSITLNESYSQAAFELRVGRLSRKQSNASYVSPHLSILMDRLLLVPSEFHQTAHWDH